MISPLIKHIDPDKVFCVSLTRREDRREKFKAQANALGIPFEFWDAVDGLAQNLSVPNTKITPGAVGCYLSHMAIWQAALDNNWESVIVFEDDAKFADGFNTLVDAALPFLPADWQFTYLGGFEHGGFGSWKAQPNGWWVVPRCLWGTHAYMLRGKNTFETLVQRMAQQTMQLDEMLYNNVQPTDLLKFYHIIPNSVAQDFENLGTDIQEYDETIKQN